MRHAESVPPTCEHSPRRVDADWPAYRDLNTLRAARQAFPCAYYSAAAALAEAIEAALPELERLATHAALEYWYSDDGPREKGD